MLSLLTSACGDSPGSSASATGLGGLILAAPPPGYKQTVDQQLSRDIAASDTSANPAALKPELTRDGFLDAHSRVWTRAEAYRSILVLELSTTFGAEALREFLSAQVSSGRGVTPYSDAQIPSAQAFTFYAQTRTGKREVFCQEVLFSVDVDVFLVDDCDVGPRDAGYVLGWAVQQYQQASGELGVPIVTPAASPSPPAPS